VGTSAGTESALATDEACGCEITGESVGREKNRNRAAIASAPTGATKATPLSNSNLALFGWPRLTILSRLIETLSEGRVCSAVAPVVEKCAGEDLSLRAFMAAPTLARDRGTLA